MQHHRLSIWLPPLALMLTLLTSCFLQREEGRQRTVLKKDWQVAEDMKGWVGVKPSAPTKLELKERKDEVWRLATHNIVAPAQDGWIAMSPETFKKYTGTTLAALNTPPGELWEMRPGRRVPAEKEGWVGIPLTFPKVVQKGALGLATLQADMLIPKEMDGWVCMSAATLEKLATSFELRKATIQQENNPSKTPEP